MNEDLPVAFRWDGDAMLPLRPRHADKLYTVGEVYTLVRQEPRSSESHRHFFAALHDTWVNLPEDIADELPSAEHLRAWALCKAGYCDKTIIKCASNEDAIKLAAMTKSGGKIRIVEVSGKIVTTWTPYSQSVKAMGGKEFQRSKEAVLNIAASLIRVEPETLDQNAGKAA